MNEFLEEKERGKREEREEKKIKFSYHQDRKASYPSRDPMRKNEEMVLRFLMHGSVQDKRLSQ